MSGPAGRQGKATAAAAARFGVAVVMAALLVLALSVAWVSGCKSGSGPEALAQCGPVPRNFFALGAPLVLFIGGMVAFARTYRVWRRQGRWWVWQGVGWFVLALMLVVLTMTVPLALL